MQRHWSAVFIALLFISTSQSVWAQSLAPAYLTFGGGLVLMAILTLYVIKQIGVSIRLHRDKPFK